MNELIEASIDCPYCGESLHLLVDPGDLNGAYTEDCQVCCQPMRLHPSLARDGQLTLTAQREDD